MVKARGSDPSAEEVGETARGGEVQGDGGAHARWRRSGWGSRALTTWGSIGSSGWVREVEDGEFFLGQGNRVGSVRGVVSVIRWGSGARKKVVSWGQIGRVATG